MASSSAAAPPLAEEDMKLMRIGRTIFRSQDFSGTCRRDSYCIRCGVAFCSHCCRYHHRHAAVSRWYDPLLRVDLDGGGRPVLPTRTADGRHALPRGVAACMAAQDYTSRLPRDAFCLPCGSSFRADLCSHHDAHADAATGEPLADAVLRGIEEHGDGWHCVRCTGSEWWADLMGVVLGDPVLTGVDEEGAYYELLPVLKATESNCLRCGDDMEGKLRIGFYCSLDCFREDQRTIEERRQRRVARHAARHSRDN
uniref:Uncharacterized protein n=1 Tax=Oryza glumipatula TaxID=40148 RepID=A0A0D9Y638_9ORYZ